MTTTTNFGLPIYGNSDKPKWTDTNEAFQDLDNKVADKTADNAFTGTNAFSADLLMKGGSTIESDDGVITPTAPSSDKTGTGVVQINDSLGNPLYKVRPIQHSNGKVDLDIAGQPAANGGTLTFNGNDVMNQGGMHTFSTSEQRVGTWIDGKPMYEKTFQLNGPFTTGEQHRSVDLPTTADNICIFQSTCKVIDEGGVSFWLVGSYVSESLRISPVWVSQSQGKISIVINGSGLASHLQYITMVLRYTKTTD